MSHNPERADKNCLNCGATVAGRYCQDCGQENIETRETFWSLTKHFVYDVLHFDGKFFSTLKHLFTKPGFVAKQYVEGRRQAYLHPIRMYLFTSAFFFLVFFSSGAFKIGEGNSPRYLDNDDRRELAGVYTAQLRKSAANDTLRHRIDLLLDTARPLPADSLPWLKEARQGEGVTFGSKTYVSAAQYDSLQATLPDDQRDSWIKGRFVKQVLASQAKYENNPEGQKILVETFLHRLPYLLFLSLPFFAGILKLLYVRRKTVLYSDHAVFTLYHYVFSFLTILLMIGTAALGKLTHWQLFFYAARVLAFVWLAYLFLELKRFYGQSVGKTVVKWLLLNVLGAVVIALLFVLFVLLSFLQA